MIKLIVFTFLFLCLVYLLQVIMVRNDKPMIIENLITQDERNYILNKCENHYIKDKYPGIPVNKGKSSTCFLSKDDITIGKMIKRICNIIGKNYEKAEDVEVVKYNQGGSHLPHYDSRATTVTLFLNDTFDGGDVHFINLREKMKPRQGGGIVFHSKNNPISYHVNIPVTKGEKYVAYLWIND